MFSLVVSKLSIAYHIFESKCAESASLAMYIEQNMLDEAGKTCDKMQDFKKWWIKFLI